MLSGHEKLVGREGVVSGHDVEQRTYQRQRRDEKRLPGKRDAASHKEEKRRDHEGDGAGGKHLATAERAVHLTCLKRQNRGADTSEQGTQPKQGKVRSHGSESDKKTAKHTQTAHGNNEGTVRHERRHLAPKGCRKKQRAHDGRRRAQIHRAYLRCEQGVIGPEGIQTRARIAQPNPRPPGTQTKIAQVGPLLSQMRHTLGVF